LGVSKPSTSNAIAQLVAAGYAVKQSYGAVTLTDLGKETAQEIKKRHNSIKTFLVTVLGVSEVTAESDACKIEHCLSEETATKLYKFLKL
jgi:Mn-dependent DtxR family transcriptional regulator